MQNDKFKQAIFEALAHEYENSIKIKEKHIFSSKFEKKMKKLINIHKKPYYFIINTVGKKVACIAIGTVIASSITLMSVDAIRNVFFNFFINTSEMFSIVQSINDDEAPATIEDKYEITYNLTGYSSKNIKNESQFHNISYTKDNILIDYCQHVKTKYIKIWNTEKTEVENIKINEFEAVYFIDTKNFHHLIWDNGEYIISISSNIDKNILIDMAESVQKIE